MIGAPACFLAFLARRHATAIALLWCAPLAVGSIAGLLYESYAAKRQDVRGLLDGLPFLKKLMDVETLDFLSPEGYFSVAFQHPLTLLVFALVPAVPMLTTPAADRGRGALDLVLAGPTPRRAVVLGPALIGCFASVAVAFSPLGGAALGIALSGRLDVVPLKTYALVAVNAAAFMTAWLGVAAAISAAARDGVRATFGYAACVLCGMLVDALSRLWEAGEAIRWATPGGFYRPTEIVAGKAAALPRVAILLVVGALLIAVATTIMERRKRA